jgi:hypothetical protein
MEFSLKRQKREGNMCQEQEQLKMLLLEFQVRLMPGKAISLGSKWKGPNQI